MLFLGLAIVPVSLLATGVRISFSPRLAAATDAWQQIAEVFGASYRPAPPAELSAVRDLDSNRTESSIHPCSDFACAQKREGVPAAAVEPADAGSVKPLCARGNAPRVASRRSRSSRQLDLVVSAEAIEARFEKQLPGIGELGALRVVTLKRAELLKSLEKRLFKPSFKPIEEGVKPANSQSMKVFVQLRKAVAGSSPGLAERKVFSALASARRRECDRAILTGIPTDNLDSSEF